MDNKNDGNMTVGYNESTTQNVDVNDESKVSKGMINQSASNFDMISCHSQKGQNSGKRDRHDHRDDEDESNSYDDDSLIKFFEQEEVDDDENEGIQRNGDFTCFHKKNRAVCCTQLKKRPCIVEKDYFPSAQDIIPKKGGSSHIQNVVHNDTVKQCSLYAFESMCDNMSTMLQNVNNNYHKKSYTKNNKKQIKMASKLFRSVKHISRGVFLSKGGSYTRRVFDRRNRSSNEEKFFISTMKRNWSESDSKNEISSFLQAVENQETDNIKNKPVLCSSNAIMKPNIKDIKSEWGTINTLSGSKTLNVCFHNGQKISIACPSNNFMYSRSEVMSLLKDSVDPSFINLLMKLLSKDEGFGYVPVSYDGLRQSWYRYKKTLTCRDCWFKTGPMPIATDEELDDLKDKKLKIAGNTMSETDIEEFLNRRKRKQMEKANNFSFKPIKRSTLSFYKAYLCGDYNVVLKRNIKFKDDMRYASETSLRMVATYIMCVSVTHILPGDAPASHLSKHRFGTSGSKLLAKHVSLVNGGINVYPINPAYVTSMDDTSLYIYDSDQGNKRDHLVLALRDVDNNSRNKKSKNYFISSSQPLKLGMRIKLTCTFAADGTTAPIFLVIAGLKEDEMPTSEYPNGIHVEIVPGLSSASAVSPSIEDVGYIVFVRGGRNSNNNEEEDNVTNDDNIPHDDDVDDTLQYDSGLQHCVKYYAENVLIEFIKNQRSKCSYGDDDDQVSNAWFDGDLNQVKIFTSEDILEKASNIGISFNKQCAKRSTCEQGADVGEMFKLIKHLTNNRKALKLPQSHITQSVKHLFDSLSSTKKINIDSRQRRLLIAFVSDLPQIFLQATKQNTVINAFVRNGMLDDEDHLWPDVHQMLNTLGYQLTNEQFQLIFDNFDVLYEAMRDHGVIPEKVFDDLKFPEDTTPAGEVIPRRYGISQEWCQRSKILSNIAQRELRKQRINETREKELQKQNIEKEKIQKKLI